MRNVTVTKTVMKPLRQQSNFERALELAALGYRLIPIRYRSKAAAVKWKQYQDRAPTVDELCTWFGDGDHNVAFVTGNGLVVVDCDDANEVDWIVEHCGATPATSCTPSGGYHLLYRMRSGVRYGNHVGLLGRRIDLKCEGGYTVEPWSVGENGEPYEWVNPLLPLAELPIIRVSRLRERKPKLTIAAPFGIALRTGNNVRQIVNPEAYCMRIFSIQGQHGSAALVRAVCILRDCDRTAERAWEFLRRWNQSNAIPPWSERELAHAIKRHYGLR